MGSWVKSIFIFEEGSSLSKQWAVLVGKNMDQIGVGRVLLVLLWALTEYAWPKSKSKTWFGIDIIKLMGEMYCWQAYGSPVPVFSIPMAQIYVAQPEPMPVCNVNEHKELLEKNYELKRENQRLKKQLISLKLKGNRASTRKIKRRTENQLKKNLQCLFPECKKEYASSLALNLHMKLKHNAGTKREREQLAFQIIEAEKNGLKMPEVPITFPPNYIERIRKKSTTAPHYSPSSIPNSCHSQTKKQLPIP